MPLNVTMASEKNTEKEYFGSQEWSTVGNDLLVYIFRTTIRIINCSNCNRCDGDRCILNYFMAYRVYLSDYLPLDIGTTAAYLSTGANQFALKILKLFI